jgi:hypothetical protein
MLALASNDTVNYKLVGRAAMFVDDLIGGDFDADDVNYEIDSDFEILIWVVQLHPATGKFHWAVLASTSLPDNDRRSCGC